MLDVTCLRYNTLSFTAIQTIVLSASYKFIYKVMQGYAAECQFQGLQYSKQPKNQDLI